MSGRREPVPLLPSVCCTARVRGPALDPTSEHAEAILVWFQDEVSTQLEPVTEQALAVVEWADIATDASW